MNRTKIVILFVLGLSLILSACTTTTAAFSPTQAPTQFQGDNPTSAPTQPSDGSSDPTAETPPAKRGVSIGSDSGELTREDAQGNVTVVITPINLSQPDKTLDFEVKLDTHSVDLSMDLSQLATLTTDNGASVLASKWDAPMGGHHVAGMLSFPAIVDDAPLLKGANTLILVLQDVDVPERTFTWQLSKD